MKAIKARFLGAVSHFAEAPCLLRQPGDIVLVTRGRPRLLVFACPDGCGDVVPVNLDPRSGPAWRYYERGGQHTLYPSVWRDEGCESHFILWNDELLWSGLSKYQIGRSPTKETVRACLTSDEFRSYVEVAEQIDEIPWLVLLICESLVKDGAAEESDEKPAGRFKLR